MISIAHSPTTDDPRRRFPALVTLLEGGMGRLHGGVQIYVSLGGRVEADFGIGESRPGLPMTPDVVVPWLSAGKPLTAAAILRLCELGRCRLDQPVGELLPEFSRHGKESVTLHHLLTHTSGLPQVDTGWPDVDWKESLERVCDAGLESPAGTTARYQLSATWLVLGEILARQTELPAAQALRTTVFDPLGMVESWCELSEDEWNARQARIGGLFQREPVGLALSPWHTVEYCRRASPGASCRGPVRELGRFYESLLGATDSPRLLAPETVAAMTSRQRAGRRDETLQHVVDFGLGVIVDSNRHGAATVPYGFGRDSSESTFGHGGSQCAMGFADPATGLVVVWGANGRPGEPQHQKRNRLINDAIRSGLQS